MHVEEDVCRDCNTSATKPHVASDTLRYTSLSNERGYVCLLETWRSEAYWQSFP